MVDKSTSAVQPPGQVKTPSVQTPVPPVVPHASAPTSTPPVVSQPAPPTSPAVPLQPTTNPVTGVTTTAPGHQQKQIGKYVVEVIREKCISAGSCVAIAPGVFALDEEQLAIILSQDGDDDDTKLLAAQSCPTAAIIVTDTETGKQVWPPIFEEEL